MTEAKVDRSRNIYHAKRRIAQKQRKRKVCRKEVEAAAKRVNAHRMRFIRAFVNVSDKDRTQNAGIYIYALRGLCANVCDTMVLLSCGRHLVRLTN